MTSVTASGFRSFPGWPLRRRGSQPRTVTGSETGLRGILGRSRKGNSAGCSLGTSGLKGTEGTREAAGAERTQKQFSFSQRLEQNLSSHSHCQGSGGVQKLMETPPQAAPCPVHAGPAPNLCRQHKDEAHGEKMGTEVKILVQSQHVAPAQCLKRESFC